jgi:DNA-binding SARP family transcriptional activator
VIEFHNEAYRFNPTLQIWLDVDEFERHIQAGQRYEQSNEIELAIKEYETGIDLYQDDFLIDEPYEEWALAPREHLRIVYLNALGNLSQNYFSQEQYAACIALCQRILMRDICREDTHCLLMRCYNFLGQRSLALRQYRACVEALHFELGVGPESETVQLAERIRSMGDI